MAAGEKVVARNRKARHDYEILDTFEAGIELRGAEVKSIRQGKLTFADAYAAVTDDGEVYLRNLHIPPYEQNTTHPLDPDRPRRLLLHKREIRRLKADTEQRGLTLIPLTFYFKNARLKVELGLAAGRKRHDKRSAIAEKEAKRRIDRALRREG